ncbi:MAG: hypothetical protein LBJ92_00830 [Holosporales bacterium]|nr:hypothetical protein [Holosporales bacterium]
MPIIKIVLFIIMAFKSTFRFVIYSMAVIPMCFGAGYVDYLRIHDPSKLTDNVYTPSFLSSLIQDLQEEVNRGRRIEMDTFEAAFRAQIDGNFLVVRAEPPSQLAPGAVCTAGQMLTIVMRETLARMVLYSMGALGVVNKSCWTRVNVTIHLRASIDILQRHTTCPGIPATQDKQKQELFSTIYQPALEYLTEYLLVDWVQTLNWSNVVEALEIIPRGMTHKGTLVIAGQHLEMCPKELLPIVIADLSDEDPPAVAQLIIGWIQDLVEECSLISVPTELASRASMMAVTLREMQTKASALPGQDDPLYRAGRSIWHTPEMSDITKWLHQIISILEKLEVRIGPQESTTTADELSDILDQSWYVWEEVYHLEDRKGVVSITVEEVKESLAYGGPFQSPGQAAIRKWRMGGLDGLYTQRSLSSPATEKQEQQLDQLVLASLWTKKLAARRSLVRSFSEAIPLDLIQAQAEELDNLILQYCNSILAVLPTWEWLGQGMLGRGKESASFSEALGSVRAIVEREWTPLHHNSTHGSSGFPSQHLKKMDEIKAAIQAGRCAEGTCAQYVWPLLLLGAREIYWAEEAIMEGISEYEERYKQIAGIS